MSTRCSGCGRCVSACPLRIIELRQEGRRKRATLLAPESCTSCGLCAAACPLAPTDSTPSN